MSRKNSIKTLDLSKSKDTFKSFLKKPTQIRINRNQANKLRFARSNDSQNSSRLSEKSFRQNKIVRKRRKQPSASIDSTRNATSRHGATLRLFSNCQNSKSNQSFSSTIVCHRKFQGNDQKPQIVNVSHSEINRVTSSGLDKYQRSASS